MNIDGKKNTKNNALGFATLVKINDGTSSNRSFEGGWVGGWGLIEEEQIFPFDWSNQ